MAFLWQHQRRHREHLTFWSLPAKRASVRHSIEFFSYPFSFTLSLCPSFSSGKVVLLLKHFRDYIIYGIKPCLLSHKSGSVDRILVVDLWLFLESNHTQGGEAWKLFFLNQDGISYSSKDYFY
jgi:hypothetical protein